jgi:hypothetical protein
MGHLRTGLIVVGAWLMLLAPSAGAVVTKAATGHRVGVMLRGGTNGKTSGASSGSAVLTNHGGPVLQGETPYLIYWTPGAHPIAGSSETLMNQYLTDVAKASTTGDLTNVFSVLGQYGSPYAQTFNAATQAVSDGDPYPAKQTGCTIAAGTTACVTDGALQAEISSLIDAGKLPTPGAPGTGSNPIFFMITPVDVNVCLGGNTCASYNFCAYHDFYTHNGHDVLYASVPFSVFATSTKGCQTDGNSGYETPVGPSGDEAYNVADDLSHELSETITDPLISAWYASNGLEVADLCEQYAATANTRKGVSPLAYGPAFGNASTGILYDQVINGDQYYNQTEFSNAAGKCMTGTKAL